MNYVLNVKIVIYILIYIKTKMMLLILDPSVAAKPKSRPSRKKKHQTTIKQPTTKMR